jgi:hypothetical protein
MSRGLPQKNALECILRDAMSTDTMKPAGVYFGTRSGKVFGSSDDGKSWQLIVDGLPQVVCVRAAVIGAAEASTARKRTASSKKRPASVKMARRPAKGKARAGAWRK